MRITTVILYLLTSLILGSCKREEATSWNADVLGPVAHGRLTLNNLVADSLLYADEDCLWHMHFSNQINSFNLDSLAAMPDTLIEKIFDMPFLGGPFTLPNNTTLVEEEENNLLSINGAELKEIEMLSGKLHYKIKSYINGYLQCSYSLPGVTYNGVPTLIETITNPAVDNTPYVFEGELDLTDYHIDLTGENGFMFNRIFSHLIIKTAPEAPAPAQVYGDDYVVVELQFIEPKVKYARGYFGNSTYNINELVTLANNINMPQGSLALNQASVSLNITNYVGADVSLNLSELTAVNSSNNTSLNLQNSSLFDAINIERAYDNNGSVDPTAVSFFLNENNSNIENVLSSLPNQLHITSTVELNPLGDVSDGNDFLYGNQTIDAALDIDIPLAIGMQNLTLTDTLDITTNADLNANGELKLYATNYFPFATGMEGWIVNSLGNPLAELITEQTLTAAIATEVPGETLPSTSVISINLPQQTVDLLNANNKIVWRVKLNTPNYPAVARLYKNYFIDFKLIFSGDVLIEVE